MKTFFLLLSLSFLLWGNLFSQPHKHSFIEEQYRKRFEQLETTVYYNVDLEVSKYLSGRLRDICIGVSRDVEGIKVNFFLDSLMYFHKNGHLKFIQASDSIGTPTFTRMYDKKGNLTNECKFTYKGTIPYQPTKKASNEALECYGKKYKNGILISEGLTVGSKKEGLHITYDKNGNIKSSIFYSKGKAIKIITQ